MSKTDCHKKPNKKNRENPPDISDIRTVFNILIQTEGKNKEKQDIQNYHIEQNSSIYLKI